MKPRFAGPEGAARLHVLLLVLAVGLTVWVFAGPKGPAARPREAKDLVALLPADSALVATVDLTKLRGGALSRALLRSGEAGDLGGPCGDYDPMAHAQALALALPGGAARSDPSLVATGEWDVTRLVACVARNAGGAAGPADTASFRGFTVVRPRAEGDAEVAVHPRGLVLIAAGRQLRDLIDVADGTAPSAATAPEHRRLRARMGNAGTVLASWIVPAGWLLPFGTDALRSPLAGVRALALRVDVGAEVRARLLLEHASAEAAGDVAAVARRLKEDGASLRLVGLGFVADAGIGQREHEVEVELKLGLDELERTLERLEAASEE
ncbi:MAG: hypothetical protein IT376_00600 [Polyangiaceae bacterium]|nr:hypothetical protein [Polyangiaceae bacterium]